MESVRKNLQPLMAAAWEIRSKHFPAEITFSYPKNTKAVSVTGDQCQLNCAHCGGHYLKTMTPLDMEGGSASRQCSSYLVSGGCDAGGKVPLTENLSKLHNLDKTKKVNIHPGLVSEAEALQLSRFCSVASFDFVTHQATIEQVYGLQKTASDYINSYRALRKYMKTLPHICIGIKGGVIAGEYNALETLLNEGADGLVFIVFKPTAGTRYGHCSPPAVEDVAKILITARKMFPSIPIHLGCVRPGGRYRRQLDEIAVGVGVNKIVMPAKTALSAANNLGLTIQNEKECCVL